MRFCTFLSLFVIFPMLLKACYLYKLWVPDFFHFCQILSTLNSMHVYLENMRVANFCNFLQFLLNFLYTFCQLLPFLSGSNLNHIIRGVGDDGVRDSRRKNSPRPREMTPARTDETFTTTFFSFKQLLYIIQKLLDFDL